MNTEDLHQKNADWRRDNLGRNAGLSDVGESFYYRFVYHDEKGEPGYTIIKLNEECHDLAQIEFDKRFPKFKAYRSERVDP